MANAKMIAEVHAADGPRQPRYAVVISGDGLKTTLASALANRLSARGITTARVRAISYFWNARSPKRMSRDLRHKLRRRLKHHPQDRFLLIGYSFGAGTLPFAINRLPQDLIDRIDGAAILAAPESSDFEFFFRSWLNKSTPHALDTAPEIDALSHKFPVIYLRGEDDFVGPSNVLEPSASLIIKTLPGGHDFNKDYDLLTDLILKACPPWKSSQPTPPA